MKIFEMKKSTFAKNKRKWQDFTKTQERTYDWLKTNIRDDEINVLFRKHLKLSDNAHANVDDDGYLFIEDGDNIVALYHPLYKAPESIIYVPEKKRAVNSKWKFWIPFLDMVPPASPDVIVKEEDLGENLFGTLPQKVLTYLFDKFCTIKQMILSYRRVCKHWNNAICQQYIWNSRLERVSISAGPITKPFLFMKKLLDYKSDENLMLIARVWIHTYRRNLEEDATIRCISSDSLEPGKLTRRSVLIFESNVYRTCCGAAGIHFNNGRDWGAIAWISQSGNLEICSHKSQGQRKSNVSKWLKQHIPDYCDSIY